MEMVSLESLTDDYELNEVKNMIQRHLKYTNSAVAQRVLHEWEVIVPQFVKVIPKDYKRMLEAIERVKQTGLTGDAAIMAAFEANMSDASRVSGN
jgi:glutamate synthase (ferredoxin)